MGIIINTAILGTLSNGVKMMGRLFMSKYMYGRTTPVASKYVYTTS
jgi:hypothetical protein